MMLTDKQIQKDVIAELAWDASINAARIGVEVQDGVVTLAGRVDRYYEKLAAERAAQRVFGVKALAVEIEVEFEGANKITDADIARSVDNVLGWLAYLPKGSIKVMAEKGWVTLSGDAEWEYQRTAAGGALRYLTGVTGVSNDIKVKPRVSVAAVKSDIEAALERLGKADADKIDVVVNGGDVTLTGSVRSWADRVAAKNSVWNAPGVRNIVDNLTVTA